MTEPIRIRQVVAADLPEIQSIYAHYVRRSTATFELTPPDVEALRERMRDVLSFSGAYLVAEQEGDVLGYAYGGRYRGREAYLHTVENSVYLRPEATGRGVGKMLLLDLVDRCRESGFAEMVAVIGGGDENRASIRLHESLGFRHAGKLERVGFKFGRWLDTCLMQISLQELGGRSRPGSVLALHR
ncbi:MAG TPA: GNAT family N-acetyltransferase [Noviherbaspirillum sp.]|jgi:phosphinothricin acetyltransferase|uniref:GNAT family N-acetyltransferase n=1 Tax=Noviherbaspirillum sp. TaxID=1926288 RepID=UPI002F9414E8